MRLMMLVVGGIASGRRTYVRSLGYEDADFAERLGTGSKVLMGLEELLREGELTGDQLADVVRHDVVCCLEVGSGVVPMGDAERAWRERVGRTCACLAGQASRVVRLVCGVPLELKGDR